MRVTVCAIALMSFACASVPRPAPPAPAEQFLPPDVEAMSLLGEPLTRPAMPPEVTKQREEQLETAQRDYDAHPDSVDAILVLGSRTADLGRYREAVAIFSNGLLKHPDDPRLYFNRGHRYITLRRFADAVRDLRLAALLLRGKTGQAGEEPDLRWRIEYHLGLAGYLEGDFDQALGAYQQALPLARTADLFVATSQWLYMTLRRLGRAREAENVLQPISISMDVVQNTAYHKLLLMESGDIAPVELAAQDPNGIDGTTILYGVGNWYYENGQPEKALPFWEKIVHGTQWPAFGYIAAEAELARARTAN